MLHTQGRVRARHAGELVDHAARHLVIGIILVGIRGPEFHAPVVVRIVNSERQLGDRQVHPAEAHQGILLRIGTRVRLDKSGRIVDLVCTVWVPHPATDAVDPKRFRRRTVDSECQPLIAQLHGCGIRLRWHDILEDKAQIRCVRLSEGECRLAHVDMGREVKQCVGRHLHPGGAVGTGLQACGLMKIPCRRLHGELPERPSVWRPLQDDGVTLLTLAVGEHLKGKGVRRRRALSVDDIRCLQPLVIKETQVGKAWRGGGNDLARQWQTHGHVWGQHADNRCQKAQVGRHCGLPQRRCQQDQAQEQQQMTPLHGRSAVAAGRRLPRYR